jgi:two-component system cell cycle response regulator DivK
MAKSVLIIEDNEHVREIFVSMLRSDGYEILDAGTGTQGIEKAVSAKPNLILLDLDLPDMTGMATARAIRKNSSTAHIPIIACSAWSGREWREEALRAGMVEYLQKPIPSELIKAKVREFIMP